MVAKRSSVQVREVRESVSGDVSLVSGDTSAYLKLFFVFRTIQTNDY